MICMKIVAIGKFLFLKHFASDRPHLPSFSTDTFGLMTGKLIDIIFLRMLYAYIDEDICINMYICVYACIHIMYVYVCVYTVIHYRPFDW